MEFEGKAGPNMRIGEDHRHDRDRGVSKRGEGASGEGEGEQVLEEARLELLFRGVQPAKTTTMATNVVRNNAHHVDRSFLKRVHDRITPVVSITYRK
jgi:hypothetical protein